MESKEENTTDETNPSGEELKQVPKSSATLGMIATVGTITKIKNQEKMRQMS